MGKCLVPDERLLKIERPLYNQLREFVGELRVKHADNRPWFNFGLCGPLLYHTPVALPESFAKNKWRLGVELEVEFHRVRVDDDELMPYYHHAANIAWDVITTHVNPHQGGITYDQSLDRGWEIVLGAMSKRKILSLLSGVINNKYIRPFIRHGGNAAMHVTVDPFLTHEEQRAFHDFWNDDRVTIDFFTVVQRESNRYCKKRLKPITTGPKRDVVSERYHRCNIRSNGAMEVRVFQAVYKIDVIKQQLDMVDVVNRCVRSGGRTYEELALAVARRQKNKIIKGEI